VRGLFLIGNLIWIPMMSKTNTDGKNVKMISE